jgi:hypothetical protein
MNNSYKYLQNGKNDLFDIKNPYSKEIEPDKWLTFCRKSCEVLFYT